MALATIPALLDKFQCASCVYVCKESSRPLFSTIDIRYPSPSFRLLSERRSMAFAALTSHLGKRLVFLPPRRKFPRLAAQSSLAQGEHFSSAGRYTDYFFDAAALDGDVPAPYIWHEADNLPMLVKGHRASPPDIPVVDIQGGVESIIPVSSIPSVVESIASACEKGGIFYIVNHGVPARLVKEVRERVWQLFSLPPNRKLKALRQEGQYAGFGEAVIGKFFNSRLWSEGFTMFGSPNSCIHDLTDKLFPDGNDQFRRAFEEYDIALRKLAAELLRAVLVGMNVRVSQFEARQFNLQDCHGAIQLNRYPPCPQPTKTMGLPAHTDSTCLTVLHQDHVAGLETFRNGQWAAVPPLQHSFVVHVGDLVQIISNGRYKSNLHRAVVNKSAARHSVVYLLGPPPSAIITPAPEVIESQSRPLYKPLTWTEYLLAKNTYFMGSLEHFTCR